VIHLKGRVHKVSEGGLCQIVIPNDTAISDVLQVWSDELVKGQPVEVVITPLKVRKAGVGILSPITI